MLKRITLILGVVFVAALTTVSIMAQAAPGDANTCRTVDATGASVIRIGVPDDAVAGGSGVAGCRIIHNGTTFVESPAAIGDLGVIRRGVKAAVNVFGIRGTTAVDNFGTELQICLRGTGTFVWINTAVIPRFVSEMPAVTREITPFGAYTCTFISSSGIAVLVNGPAAPSEDTVEISTDETGISTEDLETVAPGEDTVVTGVARATPLSGCRIETTALVRLREQPTTDSGIVTRLPFEINLQATAQTDGWVQVIWQTRQGWVSDRYVAFQDGCFND